MLTMGSDFNYEGANTWFKNLDKLIHYVNMDVQCEKIASFRPHKNLGPIQRVLLDADTLHECET